MMQVLHVFEGDATELLYLVCVAGGVVGLGKSQSQSIKIKRDIGEW